MTSTLLILFFYGISLIYFGSQRNAGFSSWHMFATIKMVHFNLKYKHSVSNQDIPLNHWDFIPHTHLTMSESEFSFFLKYLKLVHQISASGEAIVYNGLLEYKIEIKDSAILDH